MASDATPGATPGMIDAAVRVEMVTDREQWNRFVESRPTGNITQTYEWGELGHARDGGCLRLGAFMGGELVGAMLIIVERAPAIGRPYFYVPRGPVVDEPNGPALEALCRRAEAEARRRGAFMLKVEPNVADADAHWLTALGNLGFRRNPHATHPRRSWVLDIRASEEQILGEMKEKWRYNIRLAGRKGVKVREASSEADVDAFYALYKETAERDGIWIHPKEHYADFLRLYGERDAAALLLAEYDGAPIAGLIVARCGPVATYMFGASSNRERNRMPNHLLQWTAIRWARERGCTVYDFRAIAVVLDPREDMDSLYTYKQGFGGTSFLALETHDRAYSASVYWLYSRLLDVKRARDRRRHEAELRKRERAVASPAKDADASAATGDQRRGSGKTGDKKGGEQPAQSAGPQPASAQSPAQSGELRGTLADMAATGHKRRRGPEAPPTPTA
jgi:lipid II:glycine glycyltransferase (peptidoglycan interpeptide bridge formation enzyme)